MNFYMESVAVLWTTAMRAKPAPRREDCAAPERTDDNCAALTREGEAWGERLRPPQSEFERFDQ